MRIIAGERRGATLATREGLDTRPLRGRVREALFSILQFQLEGRVVLDAFAGSGAVGLEALSRGARHATLVDAARESIEVLRRNVAKLRYEDRTAIVHGRHPEVAAQLSKGAPAPFDLVFLMPPYNSGLGQQALAACDRAGALANAPLVILELEKREAVALPPGWAVADERLYGITRLVFVERAAC